jgi:hypothetical protein
MRKRLTKETSEMIGSVLFHNPRLKSLETRGLCDIDEDVVVAFFRHWHGKDCQLKCLNISYFGVLGKELALVIARLLNSNSELLELKLTNTRLSLSLGLAQVFANVLSSNPGPSSLQHLSLINNNLGDKGVKLISEAISIMPNLETVNLMSNGVTNYEYITKMLQAPKLCKINLQCCFDSKESATRLEGEFENSLEKESSQWKIDWHSIKISPVEDVRNFESVGISRG